MYFDFQGKQVYYETYGKGKPIVLLNGIMMSTASWTAFIPTLSENNMLILVDFLDQGKSHYMTENYDQNLQVELVLGLLDELKLEKTSIMGISYGGEVALKFAIKYGNRVDRLLLFNTTAKTSEWLRDIGKGWNRIGDTLDGQTYYDVTIPVVYSCGFYNREIEWIRNREKNIVPLFCDPVFQGRMKRLVYSSDYHDCTEHVKDVTNPTLIVACAEDTLIPKVEQDFLASQIKGSQYVVIPDSGHGSMYEKPLLFAALILGFVNAKDSTYKI